MYQYNRIIISFASGSLILQMLPIDFTHFRTIIVSSLTSCSLAGPLVRENWDRGKPFWGKIGAKSGQNPAKFGAKSGKSEQIGIKTEVNYPNIPGIQPWFFVLRFFHKVSQCPHFNFQTKKCKIQTKSGPKFQENQTKSGPNLTLFRTGFTKTGLIRTLSQ